MYILLDPIIIIIIIIIMIMIMYILYIYIIPIMTRIYGYRTPANMPFGQCQLYPRNWSRKGWLAQHETRCRFHRELPFGFIVVPLSSLLLSIWVWVNTYRYIFSGMNIHFNPAILMWTEGVPMVLTHCHIYNIKMEVSWNGGTYNGKSY